MSFTAACIASGPSLSKDDVLYTMTRARVYAVSNSYLLAPWADVFYACDEDWWDLHYPDMPDGGEKWTCNVEAAKKYNLNRVDLDGKIKWSREQGKIAGGGNSGFQAMNLAALQGAERIILLGYDYKYGENGKKHWFGDHPSKIDRGSNYYEWVKRIRAAAPEIHVPVINCSPDSAIDCFPKMDLREALS